MSKAKQKFVKLLEAKGLSFDDPEVQEFIADFEGDYAEMNSALDSAAKQRDAYKDANEQWDRWWNTEGTQIKRERDAYAAQIQSLEEAGFSRAEATQITENAQRGRATQMPNGKYVTPEDLAALQAQMFNTVGQVTKDLLAIQSEHILLYKEAPDLDAIEKLIVSKGLTPKQAYAEWVAPKRDKLTEEKTSAEIERRVNERLADEKAKLGLSRFAKPRTEPLLSDILTDKTKIKARSESEIREDFLNDLYSIPPESSNH